MFFQINSKLMAEQKQKPHIKDAGFSLQRPSNQLKVPQTGNRKNASCPRMHDAKLCYVVTYPCQYVHISICLFM